MGDRNRDGTDDARKLVGPDSAVARELRRSLVKLGDAATSVQQLADHLQENPEDLLRGRD